eukprot:gene4500-7905_t
MSIHRVGAGAAAAPLRGHQMAVRALHVDAEQKWIASGGDDGRAARD